MTLLKQGMRAPNFELARDGGNLVKLSDHIDKNVVLYFYPRDDTPGCTIEAIEFTSLVDAFAEANTVVLGISADNVATHEAFRSKHDLGIALLSDTDNNVCEAYGVWHEKTMNGKTFMGIMRTTFLIDTQGQISHIWQDVDVGGHGNTVLHAAKNLSI